MQVRVFEEEEGWIEECYIFTMHTHEGFKYTRRMLRKMLEVTKDKKEVLTMLPEQRFVDFFSKHYIVELVGENNLYKFTRKD